MKILKEMLFSPNIRFNELLKKLDITSDLLSYHLRNLVKLKLLVKNDDKYILTNSGKEFANRMDTEALVIEKQPKISVLIIAKKIENDKSYYIVEKRLKEPYFGYLGFISGKMRYGETVEEAAKRELLEEAGLTAKKIEHSYVLHEMVYSKDGEILEDKFFNVVEATEITGKIVNDPGAECEWYTAEEFLKANPKFHSEEEIFQWYLDKKVEFKEFKYYIDEF